MRRFAILAAIAMSMVVWLLARAEIAPDPAPPAPDSTELKTIDPVKVAEPVACNTCHVSDTPTAAAWALKGCPRPREALKDPETSAPDVVIMDQLSQIYVPVVFPHKLHADMTDMGGGCADCHHRNPPGRILKCRECHGGPSNQANLDQPSLKGAYHRQCLNCHREWDHKTDCAICHAKRVKGVTPEMNGDPTDIMGRLHPNIEVPDERVYQTKMEGATPLVTFHHKEHNEVFGLRCVECHRQQSCSQCHDAAKQGPRVGQHVKNDCAKCHAKEVAENCAYCHAAEKKDGFDHERITGHALANYHEKVTCRQCHTNAKQRMEAPNPKCETCHAEDWFPTDFDHTITGLVLNDTHKELECMVCHPKGMGGQIDCSSCHEDGRKKFPPAPKEMPPKGDGAKEPVSYQGPAPKGPLAKLDAASKDAVPNPGPASAEPTAAADPAVATAAPADSADKATSKAPDTAPDKIAEKAAEKATATSAEKTVTQSTEKTAAKPVEGTAPKPAEKTATKPVEKTVTKPAEKPIDKSAAAASSPTPKN